MRLVFLDENKWQKIWAFFLQTEERVNIGKQANCKQFRAPLL